MKLEIAEDQPRSKPWLMNSLKRNLNVIGGILNEGEKKERGEKDENTGIGRKQKCLNLGLILRMLVTKFTTLGVLNISGIN